MPVTDPVADMLTRIRNAIQVRHELVVIPASKVKSAIAKLMKEQGFIADYDVSGDEPNTQINVKLRYYSEGEPVITGLKRVSRPGLRVYVGRDEVPRYFGGLGVACISTSQGLLTGREAKQRGVGGELLFYVW